MPEILCSMHYLFFSVSASEKDLSFDSSLYNSLDVYYLFGALGLGGAVNSKQEEGGDP
jgi:hypothetical protein